MRLRQVAIAVRDLDHAVADIEAVLGISVCFTPDDELALRGPELIDRFGLSNAVFAIGDTFLEVITPTRPENTIERFLRRHGGDAGYMVLVQCCDLDAARERVRELGIREVYQATLSDLHGVHLDPRDTQGSFLSLDQPDDPAEWPWAGPSWRAAVRTDLTTELIGARLRCACPATVAERWGRLLDRAPTRNDVGEWMVCLDRGLIRFGQADAEGLDALCEVEVRCADADEIRRRAEGRGVPIDDVGRPILAGLPVALVDE